MVRSNLPRRIDRAASARLSCVVLLTALFSVVPVSVDAQAIRGRVLDATTNGPMAGAHVLLIDAAGTRVGRALTRDNGTFTIGAGVAGTYTLRVEMIGRETKESHNLLLGPGETQQMEFALGLAPIALSGLEVRAEQQCEVRPSVGKLTHTVWEEARKALELEAAVREEGLYRFSILRYKRETDVTRKQVVAEDVQHINRFTGDPFAARDIDLLIDEGFFESRSDGDFLYGPSADVLLSDRFLDSHCFFLRRDNEHEAQIGLAFEPVRGRRVPDIEGTLWIDEASAELRSLEFEYVHMPSGVARGPRGGHASFHRLPNGAFVIKQWSIHSPLVRLERSGVGALAVNEHRLFGIYEEGAEVLSIVDRQGSTIEEATRAVVAGTVWDSVANSPLRGANVYLVGTNIGATTDANGRYRIPNIGPGVYELSFRHERAERFGFVAAPVQIELERGAMGSVDFVLPRKAVGTLTAEEVARLDSIASLGQSLGIDWASQLDRPRDRPSGRREVGRLLGRIVDHETDEPLADVVVELQGTEFRAQTNDKGEFRFTNVPVATYLLTARALGYMPQDNSLDVQPNKYLDVTLRLARTAIPLDTLNVAVEEGSLWLEQNGFFDRRDTGGFGGHFITQADLLRRNTDWLTDLLEDVPGVRVVHDQGPGKRSIRFNQRSGAGAWCEPDLYVDGMLYRNSSPPTVTDGSGTRYVDPPNKVDDFNVAPASNIAAAEVYVGTNVPSRFSNAANCGVVVIWLKR